jgi:predicted phosphoribosyltransferase
MVFKDRKEAGEKLVKAIKKDKELIGEIDNTVVVSLLRGGIIIGKVLAEKFKIPHLPLVVAKIPAPPPHSPELAIGALCGDIVYRDERILSSIASSSADINKQIKKAKEKQKKYLKGFKLDKIDYKARFKGKTVFLVDDGIATGSTIRAAALFIKDKKAKRIILAVPVAPTEFESKGFDRAIILHKEPMFYAVGQFYEEFGEVNENVY